jgi:hypothetical protein
VIPSAAALPVSDKRDSNRRSGEMAALIENQKLRAAPR